MQDLLIWGEQSKTSSSRNIVIGFFADDQSAGEALRRARRERYYRSALVSVFEYGRRKTQGNFYIILLFAGLLSTLAFLSAWSVAGEVSLFGLLAAGVAFAAGIFLGARIGLALPATIRRKYASRVLRGESMVLIQCSPGDTREASEILHKASGKPTVFVIRPYLEERWKTQRRERELLSTEQLRSFATAAAQAHRLGSPGQPKRDRSITHYMRRWAQIIEHVRRDLSEAVELEQSITPSAEWLLDNAYIIRNHIQEFRRNLPKRYYRILPRIDDGAHDDKSLRVLRIAEDLCDKTDGSVTTASIYNFLTSYQGAAPLTTAELWIFPLMLRYSLIEDLAHQSLRVSRRQHDRERADFWANRLLSATHRDPERIQRILQEILDSEPVLEPHFLIRLIGQLSDEESVFSAVQAWLQDKMEAPLAEIIRGEHARQTRKQLSIANDVTSLRRLTQIDWREIFESVSIVEAVLEQDPVYYQSDFSTRDRCRRAVEEIARYSEASEIEVAKKAVSLSAEPGKEERRQNIPFYLIDKGRPDLERSFGCRLPASTLALRWVTRHAGTFYFGGVAAITALLLVLGLMAVAGSGASVALSIGFALVAIWPASEVAIQLFNYLVSLVVPPRPIPRMSYRTGIPDEYRTLVVVPTMLNNADCIREEIRKLEVRYLANSEPNLLFALLTDFTDAPAAVMPEDERLLETALNGITELNARHGDGKFFLFHRDRSWCESEQSWIGWERKRGKLEDLNRYLNEEPREDQGPFLRAGSPIHLKGIRYVITLDSDTELPHQAALSMVEAIAHPLNHPVIHPDRRVVIEGYGIIQPRVVTSLPAATTTYFSSLFANAKGTDPYAQAISDVYQDLFGESIFIGKAIYDVRIFHKVLSGRFPVQTLLSHDLIESNYLRAGFDSTIVLFEDFPSNHEAFMRRQHRWIRGDWQIFDWLLPSTPAGDGGRERNPLSLIDRWKIFDNLRRSLVAPASLAGLIGSWLLLPNSVFWNLFIAFALLIPALVPIPARVREGAKGNLFVLRDQGLEILRCICSIAFLPYIAWVSTDAILRALHRRLHSHRKLLEWQTAAQTLHWSYDRASADLQWRTLMVSLGAIVLTLVLFYRAFSVWPAAVPFLALWLIIPAISHWINSAKPAKKEREWTHEERLYVRKTARETWRFFDDLVGPESNWLPPDNSQESIRVEVAYRTSPTNIGLWMLSALAARELGYLTVDQLTSRLSATLDSIDRLEKYRGHLLNWYDLKTLEPLRPKYVSTVDSGNLLASVWTVQQGLRQAAGRPFAGPELLDGIADAASILEAMVEKTAGVPGDVKAELDELISSCGRRPTGLQRINDAINEIADNLDSLRSEVLDWISSLPKPPESAAEIAYWVEKLRDQVQGAMSVIERYGGWLSLLADVPEEIPQSLELSHLRRELQEGPAPSLQSLSRKEDNALATLEAVLNALPDSLPEWLSEIRAAIASARLCAGEAVERIECIEARLSTLQHEMQLAFLYDQDRKLFSIGRDLSEAMPSPSHYDLLASEARLTSFIAIARGEVDPEHWQALSRPFGIYGGRRVLFSWSGSMFEYLMPMIFSRTFENSLLSLACREAVAAHIEYGRSRGVPWGISESAFSALDSNQIYQYKAFGVPTLGLKRGLADDLVVAPYSTALAMMVAPVKAVENLKELEKAGLHGNKGFYEAIDYSRESREGARGAVVYAYMAHHQGMSFLAMANALQDGCIQTLFHEDLRVRAAEYLLYEGIPPSKIVSQLSTGEERPPARLIAQPTDTVQGRFANEKTPLPRTHLLSNGSYALMVTNSGGGYSRWRDNDLTRWRADATRDNWGSFCYVRNLDTGEFWSTTHQPVCRVDPEYTVAFHSDRIEYRSAIDGIHSVAEVTLSPEEDVEVRRIVLTNTTEERKRIDLTTYAELALAPHAADRAHPAFNKLFVQTEILPDKSAILASRHSSSGEESHIWLGHVLVSRPGLKAQYETSRYHFLGRGRTLANPAAMSRDLSNMSGPVLDPVSSIRKEVMLEGGETVRFAFLAVAGDSRDRVLYLIDKYRDLETVDRVFELAWTHSQLSFRYLRIQHEDAQRFQELAAGMIYPHGGLRPGTERLRRNALGQSRLWGFGISGDLPICVAVVSDPLDLGTVRELLQAHSFWHDRGLKTDLVILNNEAAGYDQPLQQKLLKLIQIYSVNMGIDRPGGVFLRPAEQLSSEDLTLFLSCAHVVLFASRGSLGRQLTSRPEPPSNPPLIRPAAAVPDDSARVPAVPGLNYFNGFGGFSPDGREYVTLLEGDRMPPAPWINVIANPRFGCLVDETGQGFAWHLNSQLNRITPWHNDPVSLDLSTGIYVRDEDTGEFWCPAAAPIRRDSPYHVSHGQGYTRIEHGSRGIEHTLTTFVPVDDNGGQPLRIQLLELRNRSSRTRHLSVTFYTELVLGRDREETQIHVISNWDPVSEALLARNAYNSDFSRQIAFAAARPSASSYTADRTEFLGRNGSAANPAALGRRFLSGRTGGGLDPCAALQVRIDLEPGQNAEAAFLTGQADDAQEARSILDEFSNLSKVRETLNSTIAWWDRLLGALQVTTPEKPADFLLNRWLLYQTLSCRIWGRSALYQSGGAFGFRDQLQDVMALVYSRAEIAREQILRAAAHQFVEGDVQHWWHPQSGAGVRTRCSDDLLWLPYVTAHYVRVTGDAAILDERVPFIEGQSLNDNELEAYSTPSISMTDGSLFEHCHRAIEKGFTSGIHGLPLIGLCDWNDGFNRVGSEGKGESVWLAWFLIETLQGFRELCVLKNQQGMADLCGARIRQLESAVEAHGWDGEWYRRAYFDDGSPLGSHTNPECRIDSLAQSWAVISGSAPEDLAEQALQAVEEHLIRDTDRLILLFTPPFRRWERNPGYVRAYPPGVRENGGQYTHAAIWVALAYARQGNGKRAVELLRMLNPIELTRSPAGAARYKCEPYALAGDVYSLEGHVGQGGWTWYTGSSSWMYRVWIEEVLGFRLRGNRLSIEPTIPAQWPGFRIDYTYGTAVYRIHVENPERTGRGVAHMELDGSRLPDGVIPLEDDGKEHKVRIQLGRLKNVINY